MSIQNLIEYRHNYSKTSGSLYQFCNSEPNNTIKDFESFKSKSKFIDNTDNESIINAKEAVPLKFVSNLWRTLEVHLINYEIDSNLF